MSIWCSGRTIGHDDVEPDESVGDVRSYAVGWSNHYPTTDGTVERPASIDTATIAPWCVPGHEDDVDILDGDCCGPWLRLGVTHPKHDWNDAKAEPVGVVDAEVILDERAVLALVADLVAWLDRPKVYPKEGDE